MYNVLKQFSLCLTAFISERLTNHSPAIASRTQVNDRKAPNFSNFIMWVDDSISHHQILTPFPFRVVVSTLLFLPFPLHFTGTARKMRPWFQFFYKFCLAHNCTTNFSLVFYCCKIAFLPSSQHVPCLHLRPHPSTIGMHVYANSVFMFTLTLSNTIHCSLPLGPHWQCAYVRNCIYSLF